MSYEDFITTILNVKPNDLLSVSSAVQQDGSIILKVKLTSTLMLCPTCKSPTKVHGYYSRKLTHSTLANRSCVIYYQQRRYRCPHCEISFCEPNPFIDTSERLTFETKFNVLTELKYCEATYTSVAKRYNLSISTVLRLFDKHVDIQRKTLPKVLSIDEHYLPNSDQCSKYCCLFLDFLTGEMIDILPSRKKSYLVKYLSEIKIKTMDRDKNISELDNVEYVSIDMYDIYRDVANIFFPKAKVCADSFHVLKHLTDDFRKVRLRCLRSTESETYKYLLTTFKYVFEHNKYLDNKPRYNKKLGRYVNYRNIRDILFENFPDLKAAYELKEYYINLNTKETLETIPQTLDKAITMFENSGIEEFDEFYSLLKNWHDEIINSFTVINGRRINNSFMESKNRLIEKIIFNANGLKNFKRTRNRLLYCLNPNDTFSL
ncbi:MAG: ISL3 family transposase [Phascolarctobacterium sp.]|uniref:ISL3 family transposase n=1 Tax=Phascolarctobacterium sp. TaxID=2049039 RepID=UPI0026DCD8D8|nr:ISL3 family transposase [Phascolarctobacterium sp.]MDO4920856.1 ISL3 family transposase [Phascolarctobacterium sp.]